MKPNTPRQSLVDITHDLKEVREQNAVLLPTLYFYRGERHDDLVCIVMATEEPQALMAAFIGTIGYAATRVVYAADTTVIVPPNGWTPDQELPEDVERTTELVAWDMRRDGSWEFVRMPYVIEHPEDAELRKFRWDNPRWASSAKGGVTSGVVPEAIVRAFARPTQFERIGPQAFLVYGEAATPQSMQQKFDFETHSALSERGLQVMAGQKVGLN